MPTANNDRKHDHAVLTDSERQPCEIWTRVMGYHRPTTSFNVGKQGEFAERRYFRETPAVKACPEERLCA